MESATTTTTATTTYYYCYYYLLLLTTYIAGRGVSVRGGHGSCRLAAARPAKLEPAVAVGQPQRYCSSS
eukprot:scaffold101441_cov18-Phaeocystis_antarctica.AAC.1